MQCHGLFAKGLVLVPILYIHLIHQSCTAMPSVTIHAFFAQMITEKVYAVQILAMAAVKPISSTKRLAVQVMGNR
jgi:hypothetical protein